MGLDGAVRNVELFGDRGVGETFGDEAEDLEFALGQLIEGGPCRIRNDAAGRGVVGSNSRTLPEGRRQPVQVALCLPSRDLLLLEQCFGLLEDESERPALTPCGVPDR